MVQEVAVVDIPWELYQLVFGGSEVGVGIRHEGCLVLSAGPPHSQLHHHLWLQQGNLFPFLVFRGHSLPAERAADVFVFAIGAVWIVVFPDLTLRRQVYLGKHIETTHQSNGILFVLREFVFQ